MRYFYAIVTDFTIFKWTENNGIQKHSPIIESHPTSAVRV